MIRGKLKKRRFPLVRLTVSNDLKLGPIDDLGPQTLREETASVWALIDTGATSSVLSHDLCARLRLEPQGVRDTYFANADHPERHTVYAATLRFHQEPHDGARLSEWPDAVPIGGMFLGGRVFQAVIGMDIIGAGRLAMELGSAITFDW